MNYLENKFTIADFKEAKKSGRKITMLTAYDYPTARILDEAGVDSILVGDSLGMVVLGYEDTVKVTMEDMIHHLKAVSRGTKRAYLIGDMPFLSYHTGIYDCVKNAGRLMDDTQLLYLGKTQRSAQHCSRSIPDNKRSYFPMREIRKIFL